MTTGPNHFDASGAGSCNPIRDWLIAQIKDPVGSQVSGFFHERSAVLASATAPVLAWLRDNVGLVLDRTTIRHTLSLSCLCMLGRRRIFIDVPTPCLESTRQDVSAMPGDVLLPLHRYLTELPGYYPNAPWPEVRDGQAASVHYYAVMPLIRGPFGTAA